MFYYQLYYANQFYIMHKLLLVINFNIYTVKYLLYHSINYIILNSVSSVHSCESCDLDFTERYPNNSLRLNSKLMGSKAQGSRALNLHCFVKSTNPF